MKDDYIRRGDALDALCFTVHFGKIGPCRNQIISCRWNATSVQDYADSILSIPSADVAPVKHGKITKDGACSICGYYIPTDSAQEAIFCGDVMYCYHCGAKMEETI